MSEPVITFTQGPAWIAASFVRNGIEEFKMWTTRDGMQKRAEQSRDAWVERQRNNG